MANYERGSADDVRVFDGGDDDDDTEGSRLPLLIVIALLVLGAFGAVVYLAYQRGVAQGHSEIPRVIAALPGPAKVAPSNAGGTQTPYTGLKIYQQPAPSNDQADADTGGVPPATPPIATKPAPVAATPAPAATKPGPVAATLAPAAAKPPPVAVTKPAPAPVALKPAVIPPRVVVSASPPPAAVTPKPAPVVPKPAPVVTVPVKPTPAPVAAITPAPAVVKPEPAGGGFVQIGSFRSTAEADAAWAAYKARHGGAIGGLPNNIKAASLGAKGTWYRLRIVTASKADAVTLCTKLKTEGGDCILAK